MTSIDECMKFDLILFKQNRTIKLPTDILNNEMNRIEEKHFLQSQVSVLDYHSFLAWQGDLTSELVNGDCSHWCFNPWMWNSIWDLKIISLQQKNDCYRHANLKN